MFEPSFTFTHEIISALDKIEDIRRLLELIPVIPPWETELRRTALINTVHYSTKVEGNTLSREGVERLLAGHRTTGTEKDKQEVLNLQRVMDFVYEIAFDSSIAVSEPVIKQMNTFILRDVPGEKSPGSYRTGQNFIQDSRTGETIFTPPPAWDVPDRMKEYVEWLGGARVGMSPVLQAGIAHLELVAIHPFWDGNGRTARSLATLLLYRGGYHLRRLFSWEEYVGTDTDAYHQAIKASLGDRYGDKVDHTPWLEYFCRTMASSLEKLRSQLEQRKKYWDEGYQLGANVGLIQSQVEALVFVKTFGHVTTAKYVQAAGVSRATAVRHLNKLVEVGFLRVVGKGRAARYVLGSLVDEYRSKSEVATAYS